MARICIVTPGQLTTNPRVVKEATALTAAGHHVSIVCGRYSPWAIEADRGFEAQPWGRPSQVAFGPMASAGTRLRQRTVRTLARAAFKAGLGQQASMAQHDVVSDLTRATLRQPADLYIAHYDAALPAAAAAARRHGAIYAFDAEDFHPGDLADTPQNAFANRIIREMERRTLPACAYVTAASAGIARAYAAAYGVPSPRVVLNVFSRTEAPPSPSEAGTMSPGPSLYWFSQTIGPDRGLEWAVRAGAAAKSKPHLYLRGALAVGYEARLRALAEEVGAADRLHLLPLIGPADLIPQMAQFDLSYIGETGHTPNRRIALVNKLFSGLIAGVPAIATDIPAHADIVQACDGALFLFGLGDVEALTAQLDSLLLNPQRLRQARETAWRLGQERFNWELEEKTLVEIVDSALRARVKP